VPKRRPLFTAPQTCAKFFRAPTASLSNQTQPLHQADSSRSARSSSLIISIKRAAPVNFILGPPAPFRRRVQTIRQLLSNAKGMKSAANLTQKTQRKLRTAKLSSSSSLAFCQQLARKSLGKIHEAVSRPSAIMFAFHLRLCSSLMLLFLFLLFVRSICLKNSLRHHQSNFPIGSDRVFLSSSFPDSFFPNSLIADVLRSNAPSDPASWPCFHVLNSASESDPANR
jgi:hypothetical protein